MKQKAKFKLNYLKINSEDIKTTVSTTTSCEVKKNVMKEKRTLTLFHRFY